MNEAENNYGELTEDTDELLALDKLENDDTVTEELIAMDGEEPKSEELITVVGVRFKPNGKIYYFDPDGTDFANGENVVVDTSRGMEYGTVCMPNRELPTKDIVLPVRKILRKATPTDTATRKKNEETELTAYNTFIERISYHNLAMKLIDVECTFDNSKLLFYFSAESRIDFRELVRELASIFHTRIELRQIGIRDETRMLGGLGICGRPFCCSTFLTDFVQVSIKMAKAQDLSLNANKISGACGKLMCCMRYEYETYLAEKAITPSQDASVMTPDGEGVVVDSNIMTGLVKVKLSGTAEDDAPVVFVREDVVLKEKYNGEKLTKTPLPKKRKPDNLNNTFDVHSPFDMADTVSENDDKAGKDKKKRDKDYGDGVKQKNNVRNDKPGKNPPPKMSKPNFSEPKESPTVPQKSMNKTPDQNKSFTPKLNGKNGTPQKPFITKQNPPTADQNKNRPPKNYPPKPNPNDKPTEGGKKPFKPYFKKNK